MLQSRGVDFAVVTNDLVTREDAERLRRSGLIDPARVAAVEAGACPHTVIREDPSLNIAAGDDFETRFPGLELIVFESGGDNLASTFSLDLVDWWIFVIDVAGGDDIPRKRGPGVVRADLLVVNKIDLAPHVGVDLPKMLAEAQAVRGGRPVLATNARAGEGIDALADAIAPRGAVHRMNVAPPARLAAATAAGRHASGLLRFAVGGRRTVLARQHVPYPLHVTRPFRLDPQRPDLSTLYLQSASGGLYRGDDIDLAVELGAGAMVHLTTQAATIVHDTRGNPAGQAIRIESGPDSFLALTPDPFVLFPGAHLRARNEISLNEGARAVLCEGMAWHDPTGAGRPFETFSLRTRVRGAGGRVLVDDLAECDGHRLSGPASPLGPYRAFGTVFVLGADGEAGMPDAELAPGCLAAASPLPNDAGLGIRLLAVDGGALARAISLVTVRAMAALLGFTPAPRRK